MLVGLLGLAAANFAWQLGSSSYFVDEVLSISAATHSLGSLLHAVSHTEISPPGYFLFQHEWLGRTGSRAEWVARLPSMLGAVALVGAVYWLGWVLSRRFVIALGSAALAATSPFVLQYAQLAQGYLFAALATTLSVCGVLQAERSRLAPARWLVAGGAAAVLAMCINYTAVPVVAMICGWVWSREAFPSRWRRGFVSACALVVVVLAPLFVVQWHKTPGRHGVGSAASLTLDSLGRLARAPFQGRVASLPALSIVATLAPLSVLGLRRRRLPSPWLLIAAIAIGEPLFLLLLSAFGARVVLTRYAAVAVPFVIVAVVAGIALLPRPAALVAALAVLIAAAVGLRDNHRQLSFYADARGAIDYIQAHREIGDVVLSPTSPTVAAPLAYYGSQGLNPLLHYAFTGSRQAATLISERRRLWVVAEVPTGSLTAAGIISPEQALAGRLGYRVGPGRLFPSSTPLAVIGWTPVALR